MRIFVALTLLAVASVGEALSPADEYEGDDFFPFMGNRYDKFDYEFVKLVGGREPGNVVVSPVCTKLLMTILYEATIGKTAKTLEDVLQLSRNRVVTRVQHSALLQTLKAPNPYYDLVMGFRMYVSTDIHPKHWFSNVLAKSYETYPQRINFGNPTLAAKKMNAWVEDITRGRIKEFISDETILKDTALMLISTIYFQGKWKSAFPKEKTYTGSFFATEGDHVTTRFMTQTGLFYLSQSYELDAQLLRLPYKGNKFSMYIILPNEVDGLPEVERKLRPFLLRQMIWNLEEMEVTVSIPVFKFEYGLNLNEILQDMGLGAVFDSFDDLRGIESSKPMSVSSVMQKASIEVNEEGTVAAASTAIGVVNKFDLPDNYFNASHPFAFFIRDEVTGILIFEGKLVNPQVKESHLDTRPQKLVKQNITPQYDDLARFVNPRTSGTKPIRDQHKQRTSSPVSKGRY